MKIIWNQVTKFSQVVAIILFVGVFFLGFSIGKTFEKGIILGESVGEAKFVCANQKQISAIFYKNYVKIETDSLPVMYLPQTISASGVRYSNDDSLVFWNKGNAAFITEGDTTTHADCLAQS